LASDSETRDSQDRPEVNPAGAGRKNERLSREICHAARGLATGPATGRDGAAEVSRGHSTWGDLGKGRTSSHKEPRTCSMRLRPIARGIWPSPGKRWVKLIGTQEGVCHRVGARPPGSFGVGVAPGAGGWMNRPVRTRMPGGVGGGAGNGSAYPIFNPTFGCSPLPRSGIRRGEFNLAPQKQRAPEVLKAPIVILNEASLRAE